MPGTLTLSTLSDGTSSTNATDVVFGSARAWVNFNGTGTVAIRASYNVSSITDNGVGDYTVNFTTAMPDAGYAAFVSAKESAGTWSALANFSQTASAVRVVSRGTTVYVDVDTVDVAIFR